MDKIIGRQATRCTAPKTTLVRKARLLWRFWHKNQPVKRRHLPASTLLSRATFPIAAMLPLVLSQPKAAAQDATHGIVTTIDLDTCRVLRGGPNGKSWRCPGLPGYPVHVVETDDRSFLSVGQSAATQRASQQTLRVPNTLFPNTKRATIEWRVQAAARAVPNQAAVPYAVIARLFTARDAARGQVLIVSKVTPTEACHVALIDAEANLEALALARSIADTSARTFDCSKAPTVEGKTGKSPM